MKNKQTSKQTGKKAMIAALDAMIAHSDKGPSGFWVEDHEGCGNPAIFPEFEAGLKSGRLVQKEHYLCPWNTAVIYGDGHGNVHTGCYYSCSISKAKYLSEKELREVLIRFKTNLQNGCYDDPDKLSPLLTKKETELIEERIRIEQERQKQKSENERKDRLKKAAALVAKYPEDKEMFSMSYGENNVAFTENGIIFFSPESKNDVVGAEKMTYDEYLEVQIRSLGKYRVGFVKCYFNTPMGFMGQVEKVTADYLCFKRIFISGMFADGEMFDGKEDHVWMDRTGLERFCVGDCLSFHAEIYRYVKTGNGKRIDFGLRNPAAVKRIEAYDLPSDEDLMRQKINWIRCENCLLSKQCNQTYCMKHHLKQKLQNDMLDMIKGNVGKEGKI